MGTQVFQGRHETLVGTELLLRERAPIDLNQIATHTPFAITSKRIRLAPVELLDKNATAPPESLLIKKQKKVQKSKPTNATKKTARTVTAKRKKTSVQQDSEHAAEQPEQDQDD